MGFKARNLPTLSILRDKSIWTMILVVVLLVKIMDCKTKLFPTAVLPIGQYAIQLVLVHEFFQVEILGYL